MTMLTLAVIGAATVASIMFVLWLIHLRIKNAGIVDIGWAICLGVLAFLYGLLGPGYMPRRIAAGTMAVIWSIRLATHLYQRIIGHPEEGRYQQLRKDWAPNVSFKFLIFFEAQALLDLILSIPFLFAVFNPAPKLFILEYIGIALWFVSVTGEAIADAQLAAFKRQPHTHGTVCQLGLWNYSRHPNYFFEWLIWVAWATFAIASPHGYIAIICPALMLFFLFRVTGIPATEAQALRSKGAAYEKYQQTTSAFIPWPKKPTP